MLYYIGRNDKTFITITVFFNNTSFFYLFEINHDLKKAVLFK